MIYDKLFDWQKKLINNIKDKKRFGLFLDCGLGKTPLSLSLAEITNSNKVLVVSINSKATETENVKGSFAWWAKNFSDYSIINKNNLKDIGSNNKELFIVNYEYLYTRDKEQIKLGHKIREEVSKFINGCKNQNVAIILDESHRIKNSSAIVSKTLDIVRSSIYLIANDVHIWLLSGTPFTQGFIDLHNQLKFLGCKMSKTSFKDRFCILGNIGSLLPWQQPVVGYKNTDELYELIHQYGVTIKSKEVLTLPEQVINWVDYSETEMFTAFRKKELSMKDKKKINELKKKLGLPTVDEEELKENPNPFHLNVDYPNMDFFADTSTTKWLRARQLSVGFQGNRYNFEWYNSKRLELLYELLSKERANYVIFYNFSPELLEIYKICDELGYNIDIYCGEIKTLKYYDKHEKLTQDEKESDNNNVIIANFTSGSTGKNWQEYYNCVFFSLPVYRDYEQGVKRVHRYGQTHTVIYHFFIQNNFLDQGMREALEKKVDYSEEMFNIDLNNNLL